MLRSALTLVALAALFLFGGCKATAPSDDEINRANIGDAPTPERARTLVMEHLANVLFDPMSAVVELRTPVRGWYSRPFSTTVKFAWLIQGRCNAKNRMGGFVGFRPLNYFVLHDQVVAYAVGDEHGTGSVSEVGSGGLTREQAGLDLLVPGTTR